MLPTPDLLPLEFYERPTVEVARDLIGCRLVRQDGHGVRSGIIVETEAYTGSDDQASHAARGPTARNQVMFGAAGVAYVYFIYGCHYCLNLVAHPRGQTGAVLLRALEPEHGTEAMRLARGSSQLTSGPGRLCQALGVDREFNGWNVCLGESLWVEVARVNPEVGCGPRVGIRKSTELPWRFWLTGNRWVSGPRAREGPAADCGTRLQSKPAFFSESEVVKK